MQVTLNIEAGQLGDTVVELFASLTLEQRREVAREVLLTWLQEPYDVEHKAHEEKILATNEALPDWNKRKEHQIREDIRDFRSSRQQMIEEVATQVVEYFKETVVEEVKNDKQLARVRDELVAEIKDKFPQFVNNAIVSWFSGHMAAIIGGTAAAMSQTLDTRDTIANLMQRLYPGMQ